MSSEELDANVIERICNHMNSDHKDAVAQYATHYGGIHDFQEAVMTGIDAEYLELTVDKKIIKIKFDHLIQDSKDAHTTLVSMLKAIPKNS